MTQKCSMRSAFYWFAEFCQSQCLSHFAASFIDIRAEGSIAMCCEIRKTFLCKHCGFKNNKQKHWMRPRKPTKRWQSPARSYTPKHDNLMIWVAKHERVNDPSAGSPTETLLRLLLPLSVRVYKTSQPNQKELPEMPVRIIHQDTQSVAATGGVYKGQGRNRCKLMICTY